MIIHPERLKHIFYSSILNNTRKIHIYTPHDYSHTSHLQELLIVFDGNSFINDLSITKTLNYLIYEKKSHRVLLLL